MNRLFSLLSLSWLFITLVLPLLLFADNDGGVKGSSGATSDRQKSFEEGSGSSVVDHRKNSSKKYENLDAMKNFDYKAERIGEMDKARKAGQRTVKPGDRASQPRHKAKRREGS